MNFLRNTLGGGDDGAGDYDNDGDHGVDGDGDDDADDDDNDDVSSTQGAAGHHPEGKG